MQKINNLNTAMVVLLKFFVSYMNEVIPLNKWM